MPLSNKIKKKIRVFATKSLLFKKLFGLLNLINIPRKIYYLFRMNFGFLPKLSGEKEEFIVSLTSYGKRVKKTLPYTLISLLLQSRKPDKIIVWLADDEFNCENFPIILKKLMNFGVEIKFCKNIYSFKKLIPALKEFPDSVIITADDDLFFAKNWLKKLVEKHREDPKAIVAHRFHEITRTDGKINPYVQWKHSVKRLGNQRDLFPTGGSGALYPPNSLDENTINEELFMKLSPKADDVWFWAMAKLRKTNYAAPEKPTSKLYYIDFAAELSGLTIENIVNNRNDEQIKAVIDYFGLPT